MTVSSDDGINLFQEFLDSKSPSEREWWFQFTVNMAAQSEVQEYVNATLLSRYLLINNERRASTLVEQYRDDRAADMTPENRAEAEKQAQTAIQAVASRIEDL